MSLSHVDTLSFTICQPGPGSGVQWGRETRKPNLLCGVTPCHMDRRGPQVGVRVPHTQTQNVLLIPQQIPMITRTCTCDHEVCNGIWAGINLGKLEVFSLIDRADCRAVPLRVRPFAVESSNPRWWPKSPGTRLPITQRVKRRVLSWKCTPPFHKVFLPAFLQPFVYSWIEEREE